MGLKSEPLRGLARFLDVRFLIVCGLTLYYAWYWGSFANFSALVDHDPGIFPDFTKFYYPAGRAILEGSPLPDSFYYSTFAALLFVPFALLPFQTALLIWGVVQFAIIFGLYLLLASRLPRDTVLGAVFAFLFFSSAALLNNLKWGQVSTLLFLAAFAAYRLHNQNRHWLSAALLGAAIAFKFFPAVFLVYFVFIRDWRYILTTVLMSLAWLLVMPALLIGPQAVIQGQLAISGHASIMLNQLAMGNVDSQNFASVVARLFGIAFPSSAGAALVIAGYSLLAGALFLVFRIARSDAENRAYWAWAVLAATVPFWIPSAWPHYFVFLPFLQALIFQRITRLDHRQRRFAIILWIFSILFSSIFIAQAVGNWFRFAGFGSLLWSTLFSLSLAGMMVLRPRASASPDSAAQSQA